MCTETLASSAKTGQIKAAPRIANKIRLTIIASLMPSGNVVNTRKTVGLAVNRTNPNRDCCWSERLRRRRFPDILLGSAGTCFDDVECVIQKSVSGTGRLTY
jgi:hypothetical protein